MIETPEIRDALERLSPPTPIERDWSDVLQRSLHGRRSPFRRRGVVLVAIAAALAPAIAAASIHFALSNPGKLVVGATIDDTRLGVKALFVASPRRGFTHVNRSRVWVSRDIEWALTLTTRANTIVNAVLVLPVGRVTLCERCRAHEHRHAGGRGGIWLQILSGHGRLVLTANGHTIVAGVRRETP